MAEACEAADWRWCSVGVRRQASEGETNLFPHPLSSDRPRPVVFCSTGASVTSPDEVEGQGAGLVRMLSQHALPPNVSVDTRASGDRKVLHGRRGVQELGGNCPSRQVIGSGACGLGRAPCEFLAARMGSRVKPVVFTAQIKSDLGYDLLAAISTNADQQSR